MCVSVGVLGCGGGWGGLLVTVGVLCVLVGVSFTKQLAMEGTTAALGPLRHKNPQKIR